MEIITQETGETATSLIQAHSQGTLRSKPSECILEIRTILTENGEEIRTKQWKDTVKRELV